MDVAVRFCRRSSYDGMLPLFLVTRWLYLQRTSVCTLDTPLFPSLFPSHSDSSVEISRTPDSGIRTPDSGQLSVARSGSPPARALRPLPFGQEGSNRVSLHV